MKKTAHLGWSVSRFRIASQIEIIDRAYIGCEESEG
jgi:hypothetical protein